MTAHSISDVVERGVEFTGCGYRWRIAQTCSAITLAVPGAGLPAHAQDRHLYCAPHHPQTNGKGKRFHETLKTRMNLLVYTSLDDLRRTMQEVIASSNHHRYYEAVGNVTPTDVYYGRREEILRSELFRLALAAAI